ncbi:MAG TPA: RagB/SusD family nutrient uptake outer membrane protein, partial [Longimicrobiales bacterium]|nr:RagB/SusD family nutrient uptake outer membrane protein [Longimicrobiales bacterium]
TFDAAVQDEILGQAYALRALHYFNLTRAWGDVPLVLEPPASLSEAAMVARSPSAEVWARIEADLQEAATRLASGGVDNTDRTQVTPGFVAALKAKAHAYQEEWADAESAARDVLAMGDFALAPAFADLFTADGDPTGEDVFRVLFTATDFHNLGYYYQYDGRFEIGATADIYGLYGAGDARFEWSFDGTRSDGIQVVKFPTTIGGENLHVIRFAEVKLLLAEALAEQGSLAEAVQHLNDVRTRARAAPYDFVAGTTSQEAVLDWIHTERRLELAFEGERWFDLVRTGTAASVLGSAFQAHEALWPIPVRELDVAPNLTQNPGY